MDTLIHRYRNLALLVVAVLAQLVLLAYQVKTDRDVRLIRVWAVTAVTPLARVLEGIRANTFGFIQNYFVLSGAQAENRRMKEELGRLKLENQYLKTELATAQRAEALQAFQKQTQSRMLAARVIGTSTGANSRVVFVDRGSTSGVMRGMAVITPDGIVGKVVGSFPTASQVQLITDPTFAAGVISQKSRVVGTLKGLGRSDCKVDYVQTEQPVAQGELFFTTGDDRVFPKGLPVGVASVVRPGNTFKEIFLTPAGFQKGLDEVLIVVEGVHQQIPAAEPENSGETKFLAAPPSEVSAASPAPRAGPVTDADRLKEKYRLVGEQQNHKFGEGMVSPDFNKKPAPVAAAPPATGSQPQTPVTAPPSTATRPPVSPPEPAKPPNP